MYITINHQRSSTLCKQRNSGGYFSRSLLFTEHASAQDAKHLLTVKCNLIPVKGECFLYFLVIAAITIAIYPKIFYISYIRDTYAIYVYIYIHHPPLMYIS